MAQSQMSFAAGSFSRRIAAFGSFVFAAMVFGAVFATMGFATPSLAEHSEANKRCATIQELAAARLRLANPSVVFEQSRPESEGFIDSDVRSIRVHWQAAAFEPRAAQVLAWVEGAWAEQVDAQGYRAPLPDMGEGGDERLDVYLVNSPGIGGLTLASEDVDDADLAHAAYVHLLVNATLSDEELKVTIDHEFAHAIHFATDRSESLMFFEASATWQEVHANPDSSLWVDNVAGFQEFPNAPVFTDGIKWREVAFEDVFYEYGAVLFLMFLEETLGDDDGQLLRELWDETVQADDVDDNEPDWFDGLLAHPNFLTGETLTGFAQWRSFTGSWSSEGFGPRLATTLGPQSGIVAKRLLPAALNGLPVRFLPTEMPYSSGCTWIATTAPGNRALTIEISASSDVGNPISVVGSRGFPPANVQSLELPNATAVGETFTTTVNIDAGESLRFAACDVFEIGDADEVGETHPITITVFDTSLPRPVLDAGPGDVDAGESVDAGPPPPPPMVCGCQTSRRAPLPGGGPWGELKPYFYAIGILAAAYMFFVRFRRSSRARKSMKGTSWKEQRDASAAKQAKPPQD